MADELEKALQILIKYGVDPTGVKTVTDANQKLSQSFQQARKDMAGLGDDAKKQTNPLQQIAKSYNDTLAAGHALIELGRAGSIFGRLLNNEDLTRVGEMSRGLGEIVMMLGRIPQLLKALEGLGALGQLGAAGLIFGGAAVVGQTTARAYGAATGTTTAEEAGTALERVNQALQGMPADQRAQEIEKLNASLEGLSTRDKVAVMTQFADALSSASAETQKFIDTLDQFVKKAVGDTGKAIQKVAEEAKQNQDKLLTDYGQYQTKLSDADRQYGDERVKTEANTQEQIANEMTRFNDENITAYQAFRKAMQRADEDYANQVQNILAQAAQSEQKYEKQYYDDRLKAAQKYGLEAARMEQQHQLEIQRMQQDHTKNLRRLAESRDALGIEDEMDRYETQRSRAEQDYQLQVQKRNQDYALQLQEMEQNFQAQRQQRTDDRAKQLADLAKQHAEDDARRKQDYSDQANERAKQFQDQLTKLKDEGQAKLDELSKQHQAERVQLANDFDAQRQDLGFFLDGEKALRDQKQQEMMVSLTNWFNQANKLITSTALVTGMAANPPTSPYPSTYQAGGYTAGGLALMHPGEFVLNAQATRAAEQRAGAALTQDRLLSALDRRGAGGLTLNTPINLSLSFGGVSNPEEIKRATEEAVYEAVSKVGNKLHRLMGAKV